MILFYDKNVDRVGGEYELGWKISQRRNGIGSGSFDGLEFPTGARYAKLYKGADAVKDVLIESNSRNGSRVSTEIKTLENLFTHYRIPANWHGWDDKTLSFVLSDMVYGFNTIRLSTVEQFYASLDAYRVAVNKLYDGDIHLDYFESESTYQFYDSGYITFSFDCGMPASQRYVRWAEDVGEKTYIGVQSVSSDTPFGTGNLPIFAGVPVLYRRTGVENESSLYGVEIASDKRYVAVRFVLEMRNFDAQKDFARNTVYDSEGDPVDRTLYGYTPVLRAFEIISRTQTEFTLYDAPVISDPVSDIAFGSETLWDALKKLNEKHSFDFTAFISSGTVYFRYASTLESDKTRQSAYMLRHGDDGANTNISELKTNAQKVNVLHCYGAGDYQNQLYVRIPATGTSDSLPAIEADYTNASIETLAELETAGDAELIRLRGDDHPTFSVQTLIPIRLFDKVTIVSPETGDIYDAVVEEEDLSYQANKLTQKFGVGGFRFNPIDALVARDSTLSPNSILRTPYSVKTVPDMLKITLSWLGDGESFAIKWKESTQSVYNIRSVTERKSVFENLDSSKSYLFSVSSIKDGKASLYSAEVTETPYSGAIEGRTTVFMFAKNTSPTVPPEFTQADNPGTNWYDGLISIVPGEYLWMLSATWRETERLTDWDGPSCLTGNSGNDPLFQYSDDGEFWSGTPEGSNVYMRVSTDAGSTWSDPIRVKGEKGDPGIDGTDSLVTITNPLETALPYTTGQKGIFNSYIYKWTSTGASVGYWTLIGKSPVSMTGVLRYFSFDEATQTVSGNTVCIDNSGNEREGIAKGVDVISGFRGNCVSVRTRSSYIVL